MNRKQLLSAVHNMIEHVAGFDRHVTRCADPTSYIKATVWITFDYGAPHPFPPQEPDPEYPDCPPGPATVKLTYLAAWTTEIQLECDGHVEDVSLWDHGDGSERGAMTDTLAAFLTMALCSGEWSATEPREPTDEELAAEEADAFLLACAR